MQYLNYLAKVKNWTIPCLMMGALVFAPVWAYACSPKEAQFITKSLRTICKQGSEQPKKTIFILVDGSDPYNKKALAGLKPMSLISESSNLARQAMRLSLRISIEGRSQICSSPAFVPLNLMIR